MIENICLKFNTHEKKFSKYFISLKKGIISLNDVQFIINKCGKKEKGMPVREIKSSASHENDFFPPFSLLFNRRQREQRNERGKPQILKIFNEK